MEAEPTPEPPIDHPTAAVMAAVAALSLESARVPVAAVAAFVAECDPPVSEGAALDALAGLAGDGWLTEWDDPDAGPGVVLSAWWAAKLGLRLNADGGRWVPAASYVERPRRAKRQLLITEADLNREGDTPLDQVAEDEAARRVRMRDPGPESGDDPDPQTLDWTIRFRAATRRRGVSDRDLLGIFAEAIGFRDWSCGDGLNVGPVVLCGVPAWPLPGQSRAPGGPHPLEAPEEGEEAKQRHNAGTATCWACKGLPLFGDTTCDACSRGGRDQLISADLRAKIAASYRRRADPGPDGAEAGRRKGGEKRRERGTVYNRGGGLRGGIGA